ncbi:MAG: Proteasome endopeptidase complex [Promethearchaeota archaeon CR_4]|nr:MAG: Proteasome endopeptidase complex [Candidatus Lokiarchaeota archaeon CR_4]
MIDVASSPKTDVLTTGTTTVGIVVKDGIVIGTESQATAGYYVASKQAQKLFKINNHTAATISGGVADCQYVVRQAQAISRLETVRNRGDEPPTKYIAEVVKNILFSGRSFFMAMMIVGGWDTRQKVPKLYGIDLLGTLYQEKEFLAFGSGSPFALGVIQSEWRPEMTKEEGIELVKKAITAARTRDAASGFDIQLCTIDKDGFKPVQGIHSEN